MISGINYFLGSYFGFCHNGAESRAPWLPGVEIEVIGGAYREVVQPVGDVPFKEAAHSGEPDRLIAIASNTLKAGEEKIIARRLKEILGPAAQARA